MPGSCITVTDRSAERLPPLVDVCEGLLEGRGRARSFGEPRRRRAHRAPPAAPVPVVTAAAVGEVGRAVGRDRVVRRGQNWSTQVRGQMLEPWHKRHSSQLT